MTITQAIEDLLATANREGISFDTVCVSYKTFERLLVEPRVIHPLDTERRVLVRTMYGIVLVKEEQK